MPLSVADGEEDIGGKIEEMIADAREAGMSDEAIVVKLAEAIEALGKRLS